MWLKWEQNHPPGSSPAQVGCRILMESCLHPVPTGKKKYLSTQFKRCINLRELPSLTEPSPPALSENPSLGVSALCSSVPKNLREPLRLEFWRNQQLSALGSEGCVPSLKIKGINPKSFAIRNKNVETLQRKWLLKECPAVWMWHCSLVCF